MKSNKHKAAMTLGAVSVGLMVSYPFSNTFLGGLVASGCEAAMVGGLADWFAVTALFRKPLGISYRTALIPRNRERIFNALADMVENELLTKDNIKKALNAYDSSSVVLHFMEDHGGKVVAAEIAGQIVGDLIQNINPGELGNVLGDIIKAKLIEMDITPIIATSVEWLIAHGYDHAIIEFFIDELTNLAGHQQVRQVLTELFLEALEAYERGLNRRILFNQLLNFSPVQIAQVVQEQIIEQIDKVRDMDHPLRKKAIAWVLSLVHKLKTEPGFRQNIEQWKVKQLVRFNVNQMIAGFIQEVVCSASKDGVVEVTIMKRINHHVDKLVADFAVDAGEREKVDRLIKKLLGNWIDAYHSELGHMVRSSLNNFSNEMLSEFIEQRVGNDLQMIRINGAVVGGLAGMLIYLLTFWI